MKPSPSLLYVLGLAATATNAFKFQVSGRMNNELVDLERRGNVGGSSPLKNSADITYYANISLGGQEFEVLIDTGSADLWVAAGSTELQAKDSGKSSAVNYAIGAVKGPIRFADLEFSGFKVTDQAFLHIRPDDTHPLARGLIGLGPSTGSNIYRDLEKSQASSPVLDRIFIQDTTTPNFITVNLGRFEDPTDIFQGDMSIGSYLPGLEAIQNSPKLPVSIVPVRRSGDQHFTILLDADGWIGPDGKALATRSEVAESKNDKRLVTVVDTGFSLTQVPKYIADGIYSRYDGAEFRNITGIGETWIVPCDQEVNMTLKFNNVRYPIHPLDATLNPVLLNMDEITNREGQRSCLGTFQPMVFNRGKTPTFDVILGMSFIRNVYALFDFGDFIHGPEDRGDPYIQMLATTEVAEAHSDFVNVRLNGVDVTGIQRLNAAKGSELPPKKHDTKRIVYFALGIAAIALAVIIGVVAIFCCCRRRKARGVYKPLHDPHAAPMHTAGPSPMVTQPSAPYNPTYNQHQYYNTPYASQTLYDPVPNPGMNQHSTYPSPWDNNKPHH